MPEIQQRSDVLFKSIKTGVNYIKLPQCVAADVSCIDNVHESGKVFSCTRPTDEDWESSKERRQDQLQQQQQQKQPPQRQQFVALNGGEAVVHRRRGRRTKQPASSLPIAVAVAHPFPVATTRERNSCNSYEAMERHDQIFENNTLRDYDEQL